MKNQIKSLLLCGLTIVSLSGCRDHEGTPTIQWYPMVTLEGDNPCNVEVGDTEWELPGFTAINTITGEDATDAVEIMYWDGINNKYVDAISLDSPGMYEVRYICNASEININPPYYATRTVYVYDPSVTETIAGEWKLNVEKSYELYDGDEYYFIDDYGDANSVITIGQLLPGFFSDSDLLGGLYSTVINMDNRYSSYLATYGANCFRVTGFLSMDADGNISLLSWERYSGFFDGYSMTGGTYDSSTETITYTCNLTWDPFGGEPEYYMVLEKVQD